MDRLHEASPETDPASDGAAALTVEEASAYLAVLERLAALEGLAPPEQAFLGRVAMSLGLGPEAVRGAGELLVDVEVPTATLVGRLEDPGLRLCLLRDAYRLAAVDGAVSDAELRGLSAVVEALGLPHGTAAAVRSLALQESRLEREFARLVREARA